MVTPTPHNTALNCRYLKVVIRSSPKWASTSGLLPINPMLMAFTKRTQFLSGQRDRLLLMAVIPAFSVDHGEDDDAWQVRYDSPLGRVWRKVASRRNEAVPLGLVERKQCLNKLTPQSSLVAPDAL